MLWVDVETAVKWSSLPTIELVLWFDQPFHIWHFILTMLPCMYVLLYPKQWTLQLFRCRNPEPLLLQHALCWFCATLKKWHRLRESFWRWQQSSGWMALSRILVCGCCVVSIRFLYLLVSILRHDLDKGHARTRTCHKRFSISCSQRSYCNRGPYAIAVCTVL